MMILTQSDELSRKYSDDARPPFDLTSSSSDEVTRTGPAMEEQTSGSTEAPTWDDLAFKETRTSIHSSGTRTIAITSAVATADSRWFNKSRSVGRERKSSPQNARKSAQPAGQLGANMQELKLLEAEVEKTGRDEGRKGIIPLNPIHNSSSITERPNPAATITAWEAAWNVTNAIQVQKQTITDQTFKDAF